MSEEIKGLFDRLEATRASETAIKARSHFETFCEYVYGYKMYPKQRIISKAITDKKISELLIQAPRGSGKSELITIAYQTWLIGRDHDSRIITVSSTLDQAELFLAKIDAVMKVNERYREVFGDLVPGNSENVKWTSNAKVVVPRSELKDPTMTALGRGGAIIGRRATHIICDDIVDEDSVLTEHQRQRVSDWFWTSLYPCLLPSGRIIVVGTRYHEDDLYAELEKKWNVDA